MNVPIISGIYTNQDSDFRTSYPRNFITVPKQTGISSSYLRPAPGIVKLGEGPGIDRGGINWRDECYRVMNTKLLKILPDGTYEIIGDVGGSGQVTFDYSFTYLAVCSSYNFFLYDGTNFSQVTDPDLGPVIDFIWVDGYFMTTDGTSLVVTELNNPFEVNPLKYGSSEVNPDPILSVKKINDEPYALNRYTIEVFQNIGGDLFPFQRIPGALIQKGCLGTYTNCIFMERLAFLGGGLNESISVWSGKNGETTKLSTREIDQIINSYPIEILKNCLLEAKVENNSQYLYIHLPDQTLVYDGVASLELEVPIWVVLTTSLIGLGTYRCKNMVRCYNRWIVGDPLSSNLGYLTDSISSCYGELVGWDFSTPIFYNKTKGVIFTRLELTSLTGRSVLGDDSTIWTQYSLDGEQWSQEKGIMAGKEGERMKRLVWFRQGNMRNFRIQKFRGTSDAQSSFAALEVDLESLYG